VSTLAQIRTKYVKLTRDALGFNLRNADYAALWMAFHKGNHVSREWFNPASLPEGLKADRLNGFRHCRKTLTWSSGRNS
jgi:hypothetical protein